MTTLIAIIGLGVLCMLLEIFNFRKSIIPITIVGLLAVLGFGISEFSETHSYYFNMITETSFSNSFSILFIILTIFLIALSHDFYKERQSKLSDFISIKLFLLSGAIAMVAFGNLAMFFLGIEVLSISLYVLASSNRLSIKSNEAGMKYFLMGSFASGFILFGICLIYGAMGSFDLQEISSLSQSAELPVWFPIGVVLVFIGMLFKIAAVPFHFWAPDVYEGSPALTTALMSTLVKVVAIASMYKLFVVFNAEVSVALRNIILIISILSMSVGNLMALRQHNVKRMLAFSGISHAGFLLITLLNSNASGTLLYYASAYALAGISAFSVILFVSKNNKNTNISKFNGLGSSNPLLAFVFTTALLSMAGIPIFAGFFAKLFLFDQTIQSGYLFWVVIAIINSIISVGYYFKIIIAMYTKQRNVSLSSVPYLFYFVAITTLILNILLAIFPSFILELI
jgi:NADH-quinone oxidoreductase subunit N